MGRLPVTHWETLGYQMLGMDVSGLGRAACEYAGFEYYKPVAVRLWNPWPAAVLYSSYSNLLRAFGELRRVPSICSRGF